MKQMRKIACDFSLCKASWEGGGGGNKTARGLRDQGHVLGMVFSLSPLLCLKQRFF